MTVFESLIPAKSLEFEIEVENEERVRKVDVGVAPIISRLKIHRKVKVVKSFRMSLLDHMEQVLLAETHRNILDHHSCQSLNAIQDGMEINSIIS